MIRIRIVISWLGVFLWAALIYSVSSIPSLNSGLGLWDFILRKCAHMAEFAILTGLLISAIRKTWPQLTLVGLIFLSGFLSIIYAFTDEFHQSFVPGRGASFKDILVDACGIILFLMIYRRRNLPQ